MQSVRSVVPMRIAKIGYIIVSFALCIFGIVLTAGAEISDFTLKITCGIIFIVFGIVRLIGYISKDLYRLAFQYDLAFGASMPVIGIMISVNTESSTTALCVALGIFIIADAICKIKISLDSKEFGINLWWLISVFAVLAGIFGAVLIFRPGTSNYLLTALIGISLISEGIMNLITVITAVKIVKNQRPDIMDVER